jgi:tetratricopeptide (TPR) repeat protein
MSALNRIDGYIKEGLMASAMEETMLALQFAPSYLALHRRMAEIQLRSGQDEAGIVKLGMVAETHRVRGEVREASEVYARLLRHSPVDRLARQRLIRLLETQGRFDEALVHYIELAELFRQMAQIDLARKTLADAVAHAEQVGAGNASKLRLLKMLGDIEVSRLDWRMALDVYQKIRQLDPTNADARARLIDLNLRLGQEDQAAEALDGHLEQLVNAGHGTQALELLEELAREHPGKQALHARLADAYRAAGRKADAIAQYDALGELQLDAGQTQAAIKTIQTIVDLEPPDSSGYVDLLANLKKQQPGEP